MNKDLNHSMAVFFKFSILFFVLLHQAVAQNTIIFSDQGWSHTQVFDNDLSITNNGQEFIFSKTVTNPDGFQYRTAGSFCTYNDGHLTFNGGGNTLATISTFDGSWIDLISIDIINDFGCFSEGSCPGCYIDVTVTGYRDGSPVSGATITQKMTGIVNTIDFSGDNDFDGVDEIRFTASGGDFDSHGFDNIVWDVSPLPVELTTFSANIFENNKVELFWNTATEVNNFGFNVERCHSEECSDEESNWQQIGFVQGHGTTNSPKDYLFIDENLPDADEVSYRLKQIDNDGTFAYSKTISVDLTTITSVEDEEIPTIYSLEQNYPNPFNPTTTIKFTVPGVETQHAVSLRIYDILGREVTTLVNHKLLPGNHEVQFDASSLPSGMYFYRINVEGKFNSVKKMMLIK